MRPTVYHSLQELLNLVLGSEQAPAVAVHSNQEDRLKNG